MVAARTRGSAALQYEPMHQPQHQPDKRQRERERKREQQLARIATQRKKQREDVARQKRRALNFTIFLRRAAVIGFVTVLFAMIGLVVYQQALCASLSYEITSKKKEMVQMDKRIADYKLDLVLLNDLQNVKQKASEEFDMRAPESYQQAKMPEAPQKTDEATDGMAANDAEPDALDILMGLID